MNITEEEFEKIISEISTLFNNLSSRKKMQVIELIAASMCCRMPNKKMALLMSAGFNKHINQLIEGHFEDKKTT